MRSPARLDRSASAAPRRAHRRCIGYHLGAHLVAIPDSAIPGTDEVAEVAPETTRQQDQPGAGLSSLLSQTARVSLAHRAGQIPKAASPYHRRTAAARPS